MFKHHPKKECMRKTHGTCKNTFVIRAVFHTWETIHLCNLSCNFLGMGYDDDMLRWSISIGIEIMTAHGMHCWYRDICRLTWFFWCTLCSAKHCLWNGFSCKTQNFSFLIVRLRPTYGSQIVGNYILWCKPYLCTTFYVAYFKLQHKLFPFSRAFRYSAIKPNSVSCAG